VKTRNGTEWHCSSDNTVSTISLKSYIANSTNGSTYQNLLQTQIIQLNNINTYSTCCYELLDSCSKTSFKMKESVRRLGLNKKRTKVHIVWELACNPKQCRQDPGGMEGVAMLPQHYFYQKLQTSWHNLVFIRVYVSLIYLTLHNTILQKHKILHQWLLKSHM
jgi:hypothetical protein